MRPWKGSQRSHLFPTRILKWIHSILDVMTMCVVGIYVPPEVYHFMYYYLYSYVFLHRLAAL